MYMLKKIIIYGIKISNVYGYDINNDMLGFTVNILVLRIYQSGNTNVMTLTDLH